MTNEQFNRLTAYGEAYLALPDNTPLEDLQALRQQAWLDLVSMGCRFASREIREIEALVGLDD